VLTRRAGIATLSFAIGAAALMVPATSASPASPPWSGNAASIAYYRQAVANTNALPALQDVELGYYWLWDGGYRAGTQGEFKLYWGHATRPSPDLVAARATFTVRLVGGKEQWYTVNFAPACASGTSCNSSIEPLEFYVTKGEDLWGYVTRGSNTVGCWNHINSTSAWIAQDFTIVTTWWKTAGKYRAMIKSATRVLITSTYTYSDGSAVTETDSIDPATKLFTGSTYLVGKSTHPVNAPYHYSMVETDPTSPPTAPKVEICS